MQSIKMQVSKYWKTLVIVNGIFMAFLGSIVINDFFPQNHWVLVYGLFMALTLAPGVGIKGVFGFVISTLISMSFLSGVFWMSSKKKWKWWKTGLIVLTYFISVFIVNALRAEW
ncbi:MAG: hypothetical protein O3A01_05730 [bacterium]|nr:hypothetical protein [bacterium]